MKRKTILSIIIAILAIVPVIILGILFLNKKTVPETGRQLATALLEANTAWTPSPNPESTVLIFYSPACDHCQREAEKLSTHPDFQEQTIYWLSGAGPEENQLFQETYAPKAPDSFHFLEDPDYLVTDALEVSIFPTIFIYDASGSLLRHYEGETEPERILNDLHAE